jgi:preprotein translocase subunit Sec63
MNVDKAVLMFAGFVVLLGLVLGYTVSPYWYLLTAFAGLNMMQASITGFCPAAIVFKKLGLRDGCAFSRPA